MSIEIKGGGVFKDGRKIGEVAADGEFQPVEGLHHKTREAAEKFLAAQGEAREPAPEMDPLRGDLTPAYIDWHRRNHSLEAHDAKYAERLARIKPVAVVEADAEEVLS